MKKIFGFTLLLFTLFGCQPDPIQPVAPYTSTFGTMTCTLNGVTWNATSFNNTLLLNHTSQFGTVGKRLDLRGIDDNGIQIILTCGITNNIGVADMPEATYGSNTPTYEGLVTLMDNNQLLGMSTGSEGDDCVINLTNYDSNTHACSGTFSFSTYDFQTETIDNTGVNGSFTLYVEVY